MLSFLFATAAVLALLHLLYDFVVLPFLHDEYRRRISSLKQRLSVVALTDPDERRREVAAHLYATATAIEEDGARATLLDVYHTPPATAEERARVNEHRRIVASAGADLALSAEHLTGAYTLVLLVNSSGIAYLLAAVLPVAFLAPKANIAKQQAATLVYA
ncbi:MAG: hypothetical protein IAE99_07970 [Rhodothermales bacterium]|nr:hypothetical protein [Rhodothermales bacterium]